jgi:hypothetical protein
VEAVLLMNHIPAIARQPDSVTAVIVSSHNTKNRLIHHFGPLMDRCVIIPHAISPIRTHEPPVLRPELRTKLPAEYIVYPSNTSPHKNHYNLLLAYSKFTQNRVDITQ